MANDSILVSNIRQALMVTLNRPLEQNALTGSMLAELNAALDQAEQSPDCRIVVIQGMNGVFCTGMDLKEAASIQTINKDTTPQAAQFFNLLRRFTDIPRVVVSLVDGRVAGGGMGLVAASDFVFASEQAQFSLPEALWGLLPCSVVPFLLRRVGFKVPYTMTLSTMPMNAAKAEQLGLVDEVSNDPMISLQKLASRVSKLEETTIASAKQYFTRLCPITKEMEAIALNDFDNLMSSDFVQRAIAGFTGTKRSFPWER